MTTIVYKDGILAADTRTSNTSFSGSAFCCINCRASSERLIKDDGKKLFFTKSKEKHPESVFRGEHVRAAAFAGNATWCTRMRLMLKEGENIEKFNNNLKACLRHSDKEDSTSQRGMLGSCLIATERGVYLIRFNEPNPDLVVQAYLLDTKEVLAIGSGSPFAYAGAKFGQLNAQQAIALAGQCDKATSLKVDFINVMMEERSEETVDFGPDLQVAFMP